MRRTHLRLTSICVAAVCFTLVTVSPASARSNLNVPAGTKVQVRMIEKLSSEDANVGDVFHGTLAQPVVINGRTTFPKGAEVTGEVVAVDRSGRLSKPGELQTGAEDDPHESFPFLYLVR